LLPETASDNHKKENPNQEMDSKYFQMEPEPINPAIIAKIDH
jgi:hypothetical protein